MRSVRCVDQFFSSYVTFPIHRPGTPAPATDQPQEGTPVPTQAPSGVVEPGSNTTSRGGGSITGQKEASSSTHEPSFVSEGEVLAPSQFSISRPDGERQVPIAPGTVAEVSPASTSVAKAGAVAPAAASTATL